MADWCGVMQGLMGCLGCANYSSLLLMRCISERNKVGHTLLYEATVLKCNLSSKSAPSVPVLLIPLI